MALQECATVPASSRDFQTESDIVGIQEDDDMFEDAAEEHPQATTSSIPQRRLSQPNFDVDLHLALQDCETAIKKFFNNDLEGAMSIMKVWCRTSLYHSLGVSIFEFIPAVLTLDTAQVSLATVSIKQTLALCHQHRRIYSFIESIGTIIRKPNYSTMTDMEAHAELCYAEAGLLQAALCVLDGDDLAAFVRATIKIKTCYNTYKECARILDRKKWQNDESKHHFQSGVRLGIATFNVMIALLPPRIITLLEFVGFSGDKTVGLAELQAGAREPGLRGVLCELTLLAYHLVISHFVGAQPDLDLCQRILDTQLKVYPEGVWFLLFSGRLQLVRGQAAAAALTYRRAADTPHLWRQLRHLCYWELMWAHAMKTEWREAAGYAGQLIEESSWSRTVYTYARAALLLQDRRITFTESQECIQLLRGAANYRQRLAGKSLPMEKWVIRRCARFAAQGSRLLLPAIEMLCLWNMMPAMATDTRIGHSVLKMKWIYLELKPKLTEKRLSAIIEECSEQINREDRTWMNGYDADNLSLLAYLRGCCVAALGMPRLALQHLEHVSSLKDKIKEDTFLAPYALVEAAMCHHHLGDDARGLQMLHEARKKYTGYALESRLQFRIHSRIEIIQNSIESGESGARAVIAKPKQERSGASWGGSGLR